MRYIFLFTALALCGCETTKLWQGNPEDEYVKIVPQNPDEDVEVALKESGREHYCKKLYDSSYANNKICYAKITPAEKMKNVRIKLLQTPEKLAIDAGRTIVVVGSLGLLPVSCTSKAGEPGCSYP